LGPLFLSEVAFPNHWNQRAGTAQGACSQVGRCIRRTGRRWPLRPPNPCWGRGSLRTTNHFRWEWVRSKTELNIIINALSAWIASTETSSITGDWLMVRAEVLSGSHLRCSEVDTSWDMDV